MLAGFASSVNLYVTDSEPAGRPDQAAEIIINKVGCLAAAFETVRRSGPDAGVVVKMQGLAAEPGVLVSLY